MKGVKKALGNRKTGTAPELVPYHCSRCGQWLCDTLPGGLARCERCGVWTNETGEMIPPGKVQGYTVRRSRKRKTESGTKLRSSCKQLEISGLFEPSSSSKRKTA